MKLREQVAIVTGGSRGIGKAIALEFAREGAGVVIAARSEVEGRLPGTIYQTVKEIEDLGGKAIPIKCDVSDEEQVEGMVQQAIAQFGRIDVLVNNAAVGYYVPIMETPVRHWDLVMRVNLRGPFLCIKAVVPRMMEQGSGSIINISSPAAQDVYSRVVRPGEPRRIVGSVYGAGKAALERLTMGLAVELKEHNIAVNALKPSAPTYSEGLAFWQPDMASTFIPPDRFMTKAALFLATQDGGGITGKVFFDDELCREFGLAS